MPGIASLDGHVIVVEPADWLGFVLAAQKESGPSQDSLGKRAAIRAVIAAGLDAPDWDVEHPSEMDDGRVLISRLLHF